MLQVLSGHWIIFFLIWPGGPDFGHAFTRAMLSLSNYHKAAGVTTGILSVLVLFFVFLARSSVYARIFAVLAFAMTVLAAVGGILYVRSGLVDRLSLGQMADASVGVLGAYFIQLFFMNKTPRFPWNRAKAG